MDLLDFSKHPGARAFVRDDVVHLRDRFAGRPFCSTPEPGDLPDDYEGEPPLLADGPTPEEAGLDGGKVEEWPWCEECQILGRGAGVIVYASEPELVEATESPPDR